MTTTVHQPSANPTNKLQAATLAAVIVAGSGLIVRNFWPSWYDPELWAALMPLSVFALGYLVKDKPNILIVAEGSEQ